MGKCWVKTQPTIFERSRYGLQIWFQDIDGGIFIRNEEFEDDSFTFEFADGSVIDDIADYIRRDEVTSDYVMGERQDEVQIVGNNDVTVTGNDKDNRIIDDSTGNVTIEAGLGNDNIESNRGADNTYIYNLGDGNDRIRDWGGQDTIKFGEGITPQNIHFLKNLETKKVA